MKIPAFAGKAFDYVSKSGIVTPIFALFSGRCTFFALVFTGVGIMLSFRGKLTADYVALVGAIQALILAHSVKEDYADAQVQKQNTTVVNDITIAK
jgi:hypothetical protein